MPSPFGQVIYGATYDYATLFPLCLGKIIFGAIRMRDNDSDSGWQPLGPPLDCPPIQIPPR